MSTRILGSQINNETNIEGKDIIAEGQMYSKVRAVSSVSGEVNIDWQEGNVVTIALTEDTTANIINPEAGASYVIAVTQSTSGNSLTFDPSIKWADGTVYEASQVQDSEDIINLIYMGNNNYYGAAQKEMS